MSNGKKMPQESEPPPEENRSRPRFLGRPVWGGGTLGPAALGVQKEEIAHEAEALLAEGGGLLILPHTEESEPSARLLLALLLVHFRRMGKRVRLFQPGLEGIFDETLLESDVILVHDLPKAIGLLESVEGNLRQGRLVIASGEAEAWEQFEILLPHRIHGGLLPEKATWLGEARSGSAEGKNVRSAIHRRSPGGKRKEGARSRIEELGAKEARSLTTPVERNICLFVALFDAFGVPIPFDLLARALEEDDQEVASVVEGAEARDTLFWVELDHPAELLVCTKAPDIAETLVPHIAPKDASISDIYVRIFQQLDPTERVERHTMLQFFQGVLRAQHRWPAFMAGWGITEEIHPWIRNLLGRLGETLEAIWDDDATEAVEFLGWGKFLEEIRDFEKSHEVFERGIRRDPTKGFLRHAHARMVGLWATNENDPRIYREARRLFSGLAAEMPKNPYVWQAWGKMETDWGNAREARDLFERALDAAQRPSEQLFTCCAYADLEIEGGRYEEAEGWIAKARALGIPSPFIPHLAAKRAFHAGEYEEARERLSEVLAIDPLNVPAYNLRGTISMKRGHWRDALEDFRLALSIHPENLPTRHALAELYAEVATMEADLHLNEDLHARQEGGPLSGIEGAFSSMKAALREAEAHLEHCRQIEPENVRVLVALAVLHGKAGAFLQKEARVVDENRPLPPERVERIERHFSEAREILERVLERNERNRHARHALGELLLRRGELELAEAEFQRVLEAFPENFAALLSLAEISLERGDRKGARFRLDRIERRLSKAKGIPFHTRILIRNRLAELEAKGGDREKALALLERSRQEDPGNAYTYRAFEKIFGEIPGQEEGPLEKMRALGMTDEILRR